MSTTAPVSSPWSLRIGSAFGIPIRVHFTFLLLLVYLAWSSSNAGQHPLSTVILVLLVFVCVLLHELGHALAARRYGIGTRDITIYPIGGIARLERMPQGIHELVVALAGPAVNLVLFVVLLVATRVVSPSALQAIGQPSFATPLPLVLAVANLMLFAFNLVPAFPMDGGRVLRALLSLKLGQERATDLAASIGQGIAILMGAIGLVLFQPILLFIAFFVFLGASHEAALVRRTAAVRHRVASEAMIRRFEVLAPIDTLERATALLLDTHQQDFPVVDVRGRVAGVLTRATLLSGLAGGGSTTAVLDVMDREVRTVTPDTSLQRVLELISGASPSPVLVQDGERLVGMITLDNIVEFLEVSRRTGSRG